MKKWKKSKTIIVNGIASVVAVAVIVSEGNVNPKAVEISALVIFIGNIALRLMTNQAIETPIRKAKETIAKDKETAKEYVEKIQVETNELKDVVKSLRKK
jgi:hypothetical protein